MAIEWADFEKVELRVGTVVTAEPNEKARKPAYVLTVDLGDELGVKTSSAQITEHYRAADLIGRQVLCVCNFEPKRVAGVKSEVLVTGAHDGDGNVVLAGFDRAVPNGTRLL
ncbi:tRNA-binding protein [Saccharomonospora saliphila]|uniref:tRNA-binding protein n=1 Tax=Saccharomonospora saliphila TaxID=369829 RepID=UPI00037B604F|nr:tRNA-binding protein [Saccharomonospora saliphila]